MKTKYAEAQQSFCIYSAHGSLISCKARGIGSFCKTLMIAKEGRRKEGKWYSNLSVNLKKLTWSNEQWPNLHKNKAATPLWLIHNKSTCFHLLTLSSLRLISVEKTHQQCLSYWHINKQTNKYSMWAPHLGQFGKCHITISHCFFPESFTTSVCLLLSAACRWNM